MPHVVHIFLEASLFPISQVGSTRSIISLSPTSLLIQVYSNIAYVPHNHYRIHLRLIFTENSSDAPLVPKSEPSHHSSHMDPVNDSGNQCITIALRSLQDRRANNQGARSHFTHNTSPSHLVAIPWWMTLLCPPMPPPSAIIRPEPLPCPNQSLYRANYPTYYSDLLHGFSYFLGGGYTRSSR